MPRRKHPAAVTRGRRGGQVSTERKAAAARANGQQGGRPSKFAPGALVTVTAGPRSGERAWIVELVRRGAYRVVFDDRAERVEMSWHLRPARRVRRSGE